MKKATVAIWILSVSFITSNLWWVYKMLDSGITYTYMSQTIEDQQKAIKQFTMLIPLVARGEIKKSDLVKAAVLPGDSTEIFEKDGYTWVGQIGLQFNNAGNLDSAKPAWD